MTPDELNHRIDLYRATLSGLHRMARGYRSDPSIHPRMHAATMSALRVMRLRLEACRNGLDPFLY